MYGSFVDAYNRRIKSFEKWYRTDMRAEGKEGFGS